ncbi:LysM peptidoglycan-binding domain-containing protein [Acidiferrimicrobium sp. IK]|nr:LysM peptidoglycan-binding domain-containing protein [Acidiferrimicrobium sp. IK]
MFGVVLTAPHVPAEKAASGKSTLPWRPASQVRVRRRRVLVGMGVAVGALGLLSAIPGLGVLRSAAVAAAVLAGGYATLVWRVRRLSAQRELTVAFGAQPGVCLDWDAFERELGIVESGGEAVEQIASVDLGAGDLVRFAAAYALGWVLTPVVWCMRLAGGDDGDGFVERVVRLQQYGRSRSLRVLTVSAATMAGVTAVGSAGAVAMAAPAYTVHAGDTLAAIAASHGTTVSALAATNHVANPNLIFGGESLSLNGGPSSGGSAEGGSSYTVRAGDTLGSIAARYGTSWSALAAANRLVDPNTVLVGQVLNIGDGATAGDGVTVTVAAAPGAGPSYTVRAGDTLGSIAVRYGTSWSALAGANHLADPNTILVGQVLQVDGSTAPVSAVATPAAAATPPAPPAPPAPDIGGAATAVRVALAQVGKPYQWGGAGPSSFDCSGLVLYAWAAAGVSLPHYTVSQMQATTPVSEGQLQPGDIVFYGGSAPSHDAMYIGGGQVVSANTTGTNVQTQPLTYDGTPTGFGRVG